MCSYAHTHTHTYIYVCMSSADRGNFLLGCLTFPFLIGLDRISSTRLKRSGKSGHPGLFPDLRGKVFTFSLLSRMFSVILTYVASIMLRYIPSRSLLLRVFVRNCQILLSTVSAIIEITVQFVSFILLLCCSKTSQVPQW